MTNKEKLAFIEKVAKYVKLYAPSYIKVYSPIIAQACLESAYGDPEYGGRENNKVFLGQNYFGLKYREGRCKSGIGFFIAGGSEQDKNTGKYVSSGMSWQKCTDLENCVKCYFEFTSISAYNGLRDVTDPKKYLEEIKKAKYATSIKYVDNCMNVIKEWNLTKYDPVKTGTKESKTTVKYYRIQTGYYKVRVNADVMAKELNKFGYKSVIRQDNKGYYSVQLGAYKVKTNAEKIQRDLLAKGIKSIIKFY